LTGRELRALRRLHREAEGRSPFLFVSELSNFQKMINRATKAAKLKIKAHPHMLRHACGFALANAGRNTRSLQAYLGHKNIQHTVRYSELAPTRFRVVEGLTRGSRPDAWPLPAKAAVFADIAARLLMLFGQVI
jgi:site-specific recombinase XerD